MPLLYWVKNGEPLKDSKKENVMIKLMFEEDSMGKMCRMDWKYGKEGLLLSRSTAKNK